MRQGRRRSPPLWAALVVLASFSPVQSSTPSSPPRSTTRSTPRSTTKAPDYYSAVGEAIAGAWTYSTTPAPCGCDVCSVSTSQGHIPDGVSWVIAEAGVTVCNATSAGGKMPSHTVCCLSRSRTYTVTCSNWVAGHHVLIDQDRFCHDGSSEEQFPRPSPFTVLSGSGCYTESACLLSSRRRFSWNSNHEQDPERKEDCVVDVDDRSGPLEFTGQPNDDHLLLNGKSYDYEGIQASVLNGIRPFGNLTYSAAYVGSSQWRICVETPSRVGHAREVESLARGVSNGNGDFFDVDLRLDGERVSQLACEASHGVGNCTKGKCGCFSYYYRMGAKSCTCSKAVGEVEWVYNNSGCRNVSMDYTGEGASVVGAWTFVRKRTASNCIGDSWELVLADFSHWTLNHHLILDLRVSQLTQPENGWKNLVPYGTDVSFPQGFATVRSPADVGPYMSLYELYSIGAKVDLTERMDACTVSVWIFLTNAPMNKIILMYDGSHTRQLTLDGLPYGALRSDTWHHVVQVWKESIVSSLYLNGAKVNHLNSVALTSDENAEKIMRFGVSQTTSATSWSGTMPVESSSAPTPAPESGDEYGTPSRPPTTTAESGNDETDTGETDTGETDTGAEDADHRTTTTLLESETTFGRPRDPPGGQPVGADRRLTGQSMTTTNTPVYDTWMSDLAVFNRAVTPSEAAQLFALGRPSAPPRPASIENATWSIDAGNCKSIDACVGTPLFPLAVLAHENCTASLAKPMPLRTTGVQSPNVVVNGVTYSGDEKPDGIIPIGPISWGFTEASLGWKACAPEVRDVCGDNCAAKASVTCSPGMQECGPSLLQQTNCQLYTSRPHTTIQDCNQKAWVELDLGNVTEISTVMLSGGCPQLKHCGRNVAISTDGTSYEVVWAQGPGYGSSAGPHSVMTFGRLDARYVRISSSRSSDFPRAQFMHLALTSKCEDSDDWKDGVYGSGTFQCHHLAARPDWCFLRGAYSLEARKNCPASCGICSMPASKVLDTCQRSSMMDETDNGDFITSALACYAHCRANATCSYFEWEAGTACRRFTTCGGGGTGGNSNTLQTYHMTRTSEGDRVSPVMVNNSWVGKYIKKTEGSCKANPPSKALCTKAAQKLGVKHNPPQEERSAMEARVSDYYCSVTGGDLWFDESRPSCSGTTICICEEPGEGEQAIFDRAPVLDPKAFVKQIAPRAVQGRSPLSESLCLIPNSQRCRGSMRSFEYDGWDLPISLGPQVVPYPVDWDGDGDMDLLLGRQTGELVYLENIDGEYDVSAALGISRESSSSPCLQAWDSDVDTFCNHWCCYVEDVGDICFLEDRSDWGVCKKASAWGVSASETSLHPVPVDWDGDGQLDILAGSCSGQLKLFVRSKAGAKEEFQELHGSNNSFAGIPSSAAGDVGCVYPDVADWDNDGDLDLILGLDSGHVQFYENEHGTLILRDGDSDPLNHVHVESKAVPAIVDIDGDGDLDLLVGGGNGIFQYHERTQHGLLVQAKEITMIGNGNLIPRAADLDGDGKKDLVMSYGDGTVFFLMATHNNTLNEMKDTFNPFQNVDIPFNAVPQAADWDGDNVLECFVGGHDGNIIHLEATSKGSTLKLSSSSTVQQLRGQPNPAQQAIDWNHDGLVDLIVGRADGEVLFHQRLEDGSLANGVELLLPRVANTFVSPHAVDWDGDGLLDLVLGDSGVLPPRTVTLTGFAKEEWNAAYTERREFDMLISRMPVFVSASNWIIAYCASTTSWFLFQNTSAQVWQDNRNNMCKHQAARKDGKYLLDRTQVGVRDDTSTTWWVAASETRGQFDDPPDNVRLVKIESDGSVGKPFCDVCTGRPSPECNTCDLSDAMMTTCAQELCKAQAYSAGILSDYESVPAYACECQNTDNSKDLYGASCKEYKREWCGRFDYKTTTQNFTSSTDCCVCDGGLTGTASQIQGFKIIAECYQLSTFVAAENATIESITPEYDAQLGSVRFFRRVDSSSNTLREISNGPFHNIRTGSRPYPYVVDWNSDGRLDLVLGSAGDEVATVTSVGSEGAPFCSFKLNACQWNNDDLWKKCAKRICTAAGYSTYIQQPQHSWNIDDNPCENAKGQDEYPERSQAWHYNPVVDRMQYSIAEVEVKLTVECAAAGGIRYFERQAGGQLSERIGNDNPFDAISKVGFVVPTIVDWDNDGEWEVIVGDNTGKLNYMKQGVPCQHAQPCSGKGLCHPVLGTCGCVTGYNLSDCSRCDKHYYTEGSSASKDCLPCPGAGTTSPVCANRGICEDDDYAKENSPSSNATLDFFIGTGQCRCSPYFSGNCSVGGCPLGMDLQPGNRSVDECTLCQAGKYRGHGQDVCKDCGPGTFSVVEGASACDLCPIGTQQQKKGQDRCEECEAGSESTPERRTCSKCRVGQYAGQNGTCVSCPPGSYSSMVGASACASCSPGTYSDGSQECRYCDAGRYSGKSHQSACTLCSAGRYSPRVGADSDDVCHACPKGSYSGNEGQSAERFCEPCTTGATTLNSASTNKLQCIQPDRNINATCTSGYICAFNINGNLLQSEKHRIIIKTGNGQRLISEVSKGGQDYRWRERLSLGGGEFEMKWCAGVHQVCGAETTFSFALGLLQVAGPVASNEPFVCVRGQLCQNLGPVMGVALPPSPQNRLQVFLGGICGGRAILLDGHTEEPNVSAIADNITFSLGDLPVTAAPSDSGGYKVCWCGIVGGIGNCNTANQFITELGTVIVQGPQLAQEVQCYIGQDCEIKDIQGVKLTKGDRIMVLDRCGPGGQPAVGVPGGGIAELRRDGGSFQFISATKVLYSFPGIFRLCFCRASQDLGLTCEKPADFSADVGLFTAKGPYRDNDKVCYMNETCKLDKFRGIGLGDEDKVLIQSQERCNETQPPPRGFPNSSDGTENGRVFGLGLLDKSEPDTYSICWKPAGLSAADAFGAFAGNLHVTCPKGTYRFKKGCEPCPLGHYCPGGRTGNYQDDTKETCSSFRQHSTTLTTGAESSSSCLCSAGYFLSKGACQECAARLYKTEISNDAACPGVCPNGTTSQKGASSLDHCYKAQVVDGQRVDTAEVFVLQGNVTLRGVSCDSKGQGRAVEDLGEAIAKQLQMNGEEVKLLGIPSCKALVTGGGRLLQESEPLLVIFNISRASQAEVDRLRQTINFEEINDVLSTNSKVQLDFSSAALAIKTETMTCPENEAFPLGSRPTSTDQCMCSFGYFLNEDKNCAPCDRGFYKEVIGDHACTVCGKVPVNGQDVKLGTLAEGAVNKENCTCPGGYYSQATVSGCTMCPAGHYCEGGTHKQMCPTGSSTDNPGKAQLKDCVCDAGYEPLPIGEQNETQRCRSCPPSFYKVSQADIECSQKCPPNSNSEPGAKRQEDCFCISGYYYHQFTESCLACPGKGVICKGGFSNGTNGAHVEPVSKPGFYLTGFAHAEECYVKEGSKSVCVGAAHKDSDIACSGHQTGPLCGACKHLHARDLGDKPCKPCDPNYTDLMHVCSLIMDLIVKASFGIFLGKQAMTAVTQTKKMDAIILRILLQWITAVSVLQSLNLPGLTLYSWTQDSIVKKEAQKAAEAAAAKANQAAAAETQGNSVVRTITGATGISFTFEFPEEFQPIWGFLVAVKGSIPSMQSPQESVECLVHRQFPTDDPESLPGPVQNVIPAIYWFFYPILVIVMVYILSLIFCKVMWPIAERLAARAKKKLAKILLGMGATEPTVTKAMKNLNQKAAFDILEYPASLSTPDGLKHFLGQNVLEEVSAAAVCKMVGDKVLATIDELMEEPDVSDEKKESLKEVQKNGKGGLHPFLTQLMKVMDPKDLALALTDQKAMPAKIKAALEKMSAEDLKRTVRISEEGETPASPPKANEVRVEVAPPPPKKKTFQEEHHIFGIFRESNCKTVFVDAFPLFLVTAYSIWDVTTRRMLGLIQVKRFLVTTETLATGQELQILQARWLYDTRFKMFDDGQLWVAVVGICGLLVWSVGFLLALFWKLKKNKLQLPEIHMLMNYGYFYNGLEPDAYWWDVAAKKFDILCLYFVTFTELFHDPRAKLIMYLGFAGMFWAAHNVYHPFDDRQNRLADRLEGHGLTVRFLTLFLVQCLLILGAGEIINMVCALFILAMNFFFVAVAVFVLLIEIPDCQPTSGDWESRATRKARGKFKQGGVKQGKKAIQKALGGSNGNPAVKAVAKVASVALGFLVGPIFTMMIKVAEVLAQIRNDVGKEVPHVVLSGPGRHFVLSTVARQTRKWPAYILATCFKLVYKLGEEDQRAFLAHTVGSCLDHLITNCECSKLPSNILDIFFALPKALSIERADDRSGLHPLYIRTAERIRDTVSEPRLADTFTKSEVSTRLVAGKPDEVEGMPTAEDLNSGLIWLQRLAEREVWEFLEKCCESADMDAPQEDVPQEDMLQEEPQTNALPEFPQTKGVAVDLRREVVPL